MKCTITVKICLLAALLCGCSADPPTLAPSIAYDGVGKFLVVRSQTNARLLTSGQITLFWTACAVPVADKG